MMELHEKMDSTMKLLLAQKLSDSIMVILKKNLPNMKKNEEIKIFKEVYAELKKELEAY